MVDHFQVADADIRARYEGANALTLAARKGNLERVTALVQSGVDIEAGDGLGVNALMYAAGCGHADIVMFLLAAGANLEATALEPQVSALMIAAGTGSAGCVAVLLQAGASIDGVDEFGDGPLMYAAGFEQWAAMDILRQHGADLHAVNQQGSTPADVVRAALQAMQVHAPDAERQSPLVAAAQAGHCTLIECMEVDGAQIDAVDAVGDTALMHAARAGRWAAIDTLRSLGADVHAANAQGLTPWSAALHTLQDFGAPIDGRDPASGTPLMLAARNGWWSLMEAITELEADVHAVDNQQECALMHASRSWDAESVEVFLFVSMDANGGADDAEDCSGDRDLRTCSLQELPEPAQGVATEVVALGAHPEILAFGA